MQVRELMTSPAICCRQHDSLKAAVNLMWDHDIGVVPVTDEGGGLAGMLTDRDVVMAAYTRGLGLESIGAGQTMQDKVVSVRSGDSVAKAEKLMAQHQIRRLAVVDKERKVIGVLSINDIVLAAHSGRLDSPTLVDTVAAICAHRTSESAC